MAVVSNHWTGRKGGRVLLTAVNRLTPVGRRESCRISPRVPKKSASFHRRRPHPATPIYPSASAACNAGPLVFWTPTSIARLVSTSAFHGHSWVRSVQLGRHLGFNYTDARKGGLGHASVSIATPHICTSHCPLWGTPPPQHTPHLFVQRFPSRLRAYQCHVIAAKGGTMVAGKRQSISSNNRSHPSHSRLRPRLPSFMVCGSPRRLPAQPVGLVREGDDKTSHNINMTAFISTAAGCCSGATPPELPKYNSLTAHIRSKGGSDLDPCISPRFSSAWPAVQTKRPSL